MLIILNDGEKSFDNHTFLKTLTFLKNTELPPNFTIELEDAWGLMNHPDVNNIITFLEHVQVLTEHGFPAVFLNHTCEHLVTEKWLNTINLCAENYKNLYIPIEVNTDSNIENIKPLLSNPDTVDKINFRFIIDREDFDLSYYIHLVNKYVLPNYIVLSIDHTKNLDFKEVCKRIASFTQLRREKTVAIAFSCGFPLCGFEDEHLGMLFKSPIAKLNFFCSPRVVLHPDLKVTYCKTLNNYSLNLDDLKNMPDLYEQLYLLYEDERKEGAFEECKHCWYKTKLCDGGCMSR